MRTFVQPPPSSHCNQCGGELRLQQIERANDTLDLDIQILVCAECGREHSCTVNHLGPKSNRGGGAEGNSRGCRFQKLDSCVPVMQSAQDCMCNDVPEALDRAPVRRNLSERNMRTPTIIIGGEFCKDPPKVLFVEHDQMIGTLAPDRPDQALNMAVLPGRAE